MQEVITHYPRNMYYSGLTEDSAIKIYLKRENQSFEHIEKFSQSQDEKVRTEIAKAILNGECKEFSKEIVNRLARDKGIQDNIRLDLQERPEYEEVFPKEYNTKFKYHFRDYSYGCGYFGGPGSFDNMGGQRRYYINGIKIMTQEGYKDSYADDYEGRKWARNAYTNYDYCMSEEAFKDYCSAHADVIAIILANNEGPYDKSILLRRVDIIERNLEKSKNEPKLEEAEEKFVEYIVRSATEKKELEDKKDKAQELLKQYEQLNQDKDKESSLDNN